ncbi:MAG: sugar phosphate isomerase/epimerase family protein, partial [Anaerolineae bacterium]
MQIGVMNHPGQDPLQEIEWIGQNGFDYVDFTFEPPTADPDALDLAAIKSALERHGLGLVGHCAWFIPISSPFSSLRQAAGGEFRRALRATADLGATLLTVHYLKTPPLLPEEAVVEWHIEVLSELCADAAGLGVTVALENTPHAGGRQLKNIRKILAAVPELGLHLDSGHTKLEGDRDRWDEYLKHLSDRLVHVHLSDNDGSRDQHLPLGAVPGSKTDWAKHLAKLKATGYDGTITLEIFAPEKVYLLQSRDLVRRWWAAQ